MKIVVLDSYVTAGDYSWQELSLMGDVKVYDRTMPSEVIERCEDAMAIFSNKVLITKEVMDALPMLKFVGVMATGTNIIDIAEATAHGITVCNVPAYSTQAVAQHVFALLLYITNHVGLYADSVKNGDWAKSVDFSYLLQPIHELGGLVIGVYGLGNIGMSVANIAHAFGMRVIALTSKTVAELPEWITSVDKTALFTNADVLSINAPLTDKNMHFVNRESLSLMKTTAIVINTARGGLIDEKALADALNDRLIFAAAVDVLSTEPPKKDNPLLTAHNCFITPHIGWASEEARARLRQICAENLKAWLNGRPINVVNRP
jgi:glycerate dehydrogenase